MVSPAVGTNHNLREGKSISKSPIGVTIKYGYKLKCFEGENK
jgi:hypothetical protein